MKEIILASVSPRRREIIQNIPLNFTVMPSRYEENLEKCGSESAHKTKFSRKTVEKISYCKAKDVASALDSTSRDALVIAADTMVILESVCLLKPQDFSEAFSLLKKLSGKTHKVITAITLYDVLTKRHMTRSLTTIVEFRELQDDEIKHYIEEFKPFDKAGSYGIQDFVDENSAFAPPERSFVKKIVGDYYNVVGISPKLLMEMLESINKLLK
ncbi:septum formation protein [Candidatus Gastranaerophilus sp. (ex Termes propinquus)]|nr:septum formation protein [Candidatus Gastranaerophilus sp. (ex Termes propinquus)]